MPINLKTICDVYQTSLSPSEAEKWIAQKRKEIDNPELSLEAKAISLIGRELYEKFIRGYTIKQWNKSPSELPAGIISRLPVRLNFNSDYFSDPFQGIPTNGYSSLFKRLLENDRISILLNTEFSAVRSQLPPSAVVIYTGMLDEYFDYTLGELEWRSLKFSWEAHPVQDFQGTAVMNYADESIPYTRIHEFKHYHPERRDIFTSPHTVICREFSRGWMRGQEAYYPVNTIRNQNLFEEYEKLAGTRKNLIFGGRLGRYSYWNMDQAIENALEIFEKKIFIAHKNI